MSRVLTDSLTHAYAKREKKTIIDVSSNGPFYFTSQNPLDITSNVHFRNQVPYVYAFVGHGFSGSYHRTLHTIPTLFELSPLVASEPVQGFHLRGCLSLLSIPNTSIFFSCYATVRLYWTSSKVPSPPLIHQIW